MIAVLAAVKRCASCIFFWKLPVFFTPFSGLFRENAVFCFTRLFHKSLKMSELSVCTKAIQTKPTPCLLGNRLNLYLATIWKLPFFEQKLYCAKIKQHCKPKKNTIMHTITAEARTSTPLITLANIMSETEMLRIAQIAEQRTIPKNGYLYRPGDIADTVYFVRQGRIKIGSRSAENKEVIKSIVNTNEMVGELCLAGETIRTDFARAMNQEVKVYAVPAHTLLRLLQDYPEMSIKIISHIGNRLVAADRRLESMVFKDARSRIVEFLIECAGHTGIKVGYEVLLKQFLTHQEIANITATSRQTVTTVLNDLKKLNLIYIYRKNILIRDVSKLH